MYCYQERQHSWYLRTDAKTFFPQAVLPWEINIGTFFPVGCNITHDLIKFVIGILYLLSMNAGLTCTCAVEFVNPKKARTHCCQVQYQVTTRMYSFNFPCATPPAHARNIIIHL
jgi:hypothetical protein